MDLTGTFLSDDLAVPTKWAMPAGTQMCGGCWLLIWVDGEPAEGPSPPHASFSLNIAGGFVGLFASDATLIDHLDYESQPTDHSLGRLPDGAAEQRVLSLVTPETANDAQTSPLVLNEYNAVSPSKLLANGNSDTFWGRILGNGGDWFELVVTTDHLDVRGWQLAITNDTGDPDETSFVLTLTNDLLWSDLRRGRF